MPSALDVARERLEAFVPDAVKVLIDLALTAENEAVQLKALETILDRGGLGKSTTVHVAVDEHERRLVKGEAEAVLDKLARNRAALPAVTPSLDTLIVLEGEDVDTPYVLDSDVVEAELVTD